MEEPISFLQTTYPARTIGYLIKNMLGVSEYVTVKKCLENNDSSYMLDILSDTLFISETSFFLSLRRRSLVDLLHDIETTTPSIYHLLYTRLSEKEIHENFIESRRVLTERCFFISDAKKLMSYYGKSDFLNYAKLLVNTEKYQYFVESKNERSEAWHAKNSGNDFGECQQSLYVQYR